MSRTNFKPGTLLNPLPVVMAAVDDGEGGANIITIAWTGIVNSNPPMTYISVKPERYSYELLKKAGNFTINLVTQELAKAADYCGVRSGKNVDKWFAIEKVMELENIKKEEVMALGDNNNDIVMIKNAGLGVAMGHSNEQVKKVADYITVDNNEDGVAKAIEQYVL